MITGTYLLSFHNQTQRKWVSLVDLGDPLEGR